MTMAPHGVLGCPRVGEGKGRPEAYLRRLVRLRLMAWNRTGRHEDEGETLWPCGCCGAHSLGVTVRARGGAVRSQDVPQDGGFCAEVGGGQVAGGQAGRRASGPAAAQRCECALLSW